MTVSKRTPCWQWPGARRKSDNRATAHRSHGHRYAYALVYEALHGPQPAGTTYHHACGNPACVRPGPEHVVATRGHAEHARKHVPDLIARNVARTKTECVNGHDMTDPANIGWGSRNGKPERYCRACRALWKRRRARRADT